ncbi:regulatory protein RecX [Micrococcus luteus]|uniref:regulatory protein RecX n=2 Tax=Micrococcaceae TaxID=1268 RepID=UPI00128C834E|nr:regulatory protein RecX [Micrococcus luteus]MPZ03730.1 regulatory protein RecX [Micrococcus luteus]NNM37084.1 regulatory protein RecX [Micrococcus luteus]
MTRSRRSVGGGAAHRSETTGRSGSASGASAFDDARDSDVGRMWLDLAGAPEPTSSDADATDAEQDAVPAHDAGAPAGDVPDHAPGAAPDLGALLTRASDLPSPAPGAGPRSLPWSERQDNRADTERRGRQRSTTPPRRGRHRDEGRPAVDPRPSVETDRPRRRPGPAPLPTAPREREEAAREVVLRQLALGPRSRGQLERKLAERQAEPELIERVLDRFEEVRLVDDAAFAEVWVRSRHRSKGLARRAIGHELQQKGVDREIAAEALEAIDGEDERTAALDLVRRRLRGRTVPGGASPEARAERDKVTRRLVGMLGRKGYGGGLAFAVVKEVLAEHEE